MYIFGSDTANLTNTTLPHYRIARVRGFGRPMLLISCSCLALFSAEAVAQIAPSVSAPVETASASEPPLPPAGDALESVVVTATKVRTELQKTPIAISAISAATLSQQNIVAPKDLDTIVPGLVVNTTPSNPLAITVRGAGYEGIENTSAQPGVSYNINGVYIASPISLNANFLDVDTVEVVRGPQGTVLGQNSDGGAINVTTVKPELGEYSGFVNGSVGSFDYDRIRGAVNVPIGDTVAVRVALQQEKHDGWATATQVPGTGGNYQLGNEDSVNARIDVLWRPIDPLTIEVWAEHYHNATNGDGYKNLDDPNPDPRLVTQDWPSKMRQRADNIALNASYDLDWSVLKYIGSYQAGSLDGSEDLDKLSYATALPLLGVHDIDVVNNREGHSYTSEFDLTSKPGGDLDWIAGVFYLQQRYNEAVEEYQYNNNAFNQAQYAGGNFNFYAPYGLPVNLSASNPYYGETANFSGPIAFETRDTQKLYSGSLYAQGTYHFSDALRLTIGARGTTDKQNGVIQDYFGLVDRNNGASVAALHTRFQRVTGKVDLEYDWAPVNTVYALVSNGIKPGGANLNPEAAVLPEVFAPERVLAFELGSKNQFFDNNLRLNVSLFYNKITGYQVDSEDPVPFQGGLTNVGSAHVDGLEMEATQLLPYNLRLDGNLTAQQSKVDSHQQLLDPAIAEQIDIANLGPFNGNDVNQRFAAFGAASSDIYGHQLPKVPNFTINLALQHKLYFDDGGKLLSAIHFVYRNSYFFRIYNSPTTDLVPPQRQIDLSFTYTPSDPHWQVDFLITNLTDSASVNSRYTDNFGTFITANYYAPPRQFIGRVGYRF